MTISQKILSSQDVDTYDVDKRSNLKVVAPVHPTEIFREDPANHMLTNCKPICPAPVTRTVWKKGPPKINFLKDGMPFWIWSAILILVLTVTLAFAPDMLFTTKYNVQLSKFVPVTKCTIFDLSKYYAVAVLLLWVALGTAGYFLEVRTVAGRVRTPEELSYMAKEYAFSCLGLFFQLIILLLWRVFVEANYTSEAVPITLWGISTVILQLIGSFFWLDASTYWMHYIAHIKWPINIYAMSHHFHHLFKEPSSLAQTTQEPVEEILLVLFTKCIQFVVPIESWILDWNLLLLTIASFLGHMTDIGFFSSLPGWDAIGLGFLPVNKTKMHRLHHLYVTCNYSIFALTYWDILLGTVRTSTRKWEQLKRLCLLAKKSPSKEI